MGFLAWIAAGLSTAGLIIIIIPAYRIGSFETVIIRSRQNDYRR